LLLDNVRNNMMRLMVSSASSKRQNMEQDLGGSRVEERMDGRVGTGLHTILEEEPLDLIEGASPIKLREKCEDTTARWLGLH
jgi:hypothetical protein